MAAWRFVAWRVGAWGLTGPSAELTEAHDRKITWRLSDTCEASFTLDARHPLALEVEELTFDLGIFRDNQLVFRGRIGSSSDDVQPDAHRVTFTAVDYTAVLGRRDLKSPQAPWTFTNIAQGLIVRNLIDWTQNEVGGYLEINYVSIPSTAILRTITFPVGKLIGEAIADLARLDNGFDWAIEPESSGELHAEIWHPSRGGARDLILEYGSTVGAVARTFDSAEYANAILATGADGVAAQVATAADLATRPEKRIELVESYPDITSTSILLARAIASLAARSTLNPAYTCVMFPGKWSPGELWLGDATWLQVRSGRLNVSSSQRVVQIAVDVDDAGVESVAISLVRTPTNMARRFRSLDRRLAKVERLGTV
jgi:hypothetical protein